MHNGSRRARSELVPRPPQAQSHICTLHDIGHHEGVDFLVMEYLDGETLAARIEKGPVALHQVLRTRMEIASALDKAHRQGLIHRDLKPANVMIKGKRPL